MEDDYYSPAKPSGISALPPELIKAILDCLLPDKRSLKSSSLVSRNWTDFAQALLFRSVCFFLKPDQDAPWAADASKEDPTLAIFSEFLLDHPHICGYIRQLHLRPQTGLGISPIRVANSCRFTFLLRKLPVLHTLIIEWIRFIVPPDHAEQRSRLFKPTTLRNLLLRHVYMNETSFQTLFKVLDVRGTFLALPLYATRLPTPVVRPVTQCSAEKVVLREGDAYSFYNMTMHYQCYPRLTVFSVESLDSIGLHTGMENLAQFLTHNGSRLRQLHLDITDVAPVHHSISPQPWSVPDFRRLCPTLETLSLFFHAATDEANPKSTPVVSRSTSEFVTQALSSVPKTLSGLIMDVSMDGCSVETQPEAPNFWKDLRRALDNLPCLTSVRIANRKLASDYWSCDTRTPFELPMIPLSSTTRGSIEEAFSHGDVFSRVAIRWD